MDGFLINNMNKKILPSTLIVIFALVSLTAAIAISYNFFFTHQEDAILSVDPDTGLEILDNNHTEGAMVDGDLTITVATNPSIFNYGLDTREFYVIQEALSEYNEGSLNKKYRTGAVNRDSFSYNEDSQTFTFQVRLGTPSSKEYVDVTATRSARYNIMEVTIYQNSQQVYRNDNMKINKRL